MRACPSASVLFGLLRSLSRLTVCACFSFSGGAQAVCASEIVHTRPEQRITVKSSLIIFSFFSASSLSTRGPLLLVFIRARVRRSLCLIAPTLPIPPPPPRLPIKTALSTPPPVSVARPSLRTSVSPSEPPPRLTAAAQEALRRQGHRT